MGDRESARAGGQRGRGLLRSEVGTVSHKRCSPARHGSDRCSRTARPDLEQGIDVVCLVVHAESFWLFGFGQARCQKCAAQRREARGRRYLDKHLQL